VVAHLSGRIDFNHAGEFQKDLESLVGDAAAISAGLVLQCEDLKYVSSAGLRGFLMATRLAKNRSVTLVASNLCQAVLEVFIMSGFDRLIPIAETEEEALQKVRSSV